MEMNVSVAQRLTQTLTTELIQHLEILQYSSVELEQHIYEKANENPLLTVIETNMNHVKDILDLATMSQRGSQPQRKEHYDFIQSQLTQQHSHLSHLFDQIPLHPTISSQDREILKYLIHNLDERLFLDIELSDVAKKFTISLSYAEKMVDLLQSFEPLGVGARSFKEYLLIQTEDDIAAPPFASQFIQNNLTDIADLSIKYLSTIYNISIKETQKTIQYIQNLKPIPSSFTSDGKRESIIPDVFITKLNEEWIIELNDWLLPKIEINQNYVNLLKNSTENAKYYQSCMKDIMVLTQGIEQRDKTLYSLTRLLLILQAPFFEQGMNALSPMRLKDVAEALHMHESTISRAIRNKYIRTPHGIFALQSLFTKGLVNSAGKVDSVSYIKRRIKELIENESRNAPLSDQQLMIELAAEEIQLSRRTIAKYRKELNIANSSKRIYM